MLRGCNAKNQNVKNVKLKRINNKECKKSEVLINRACEVKMVIKLFSHIPC